MKKFNILVCVVVLAFLSGCASLNMSQPSGSVDAVVKTDLKADISVGEKISGESKSNIIMGLFSFGGDSKFADGVNYNGGSSLSMGLNPVDAVKSAAAYNAVTKSGADIIVAPKYIIEVNSYVVFKTIKVTVTGYKGTITGIK